jgi:ABC-type uncharacterized transport system ATPase subunit
MTTGMLEMTSGEILFDGAPIHRDLTAYKRRLGYVPEEPHLSGLEYLTMVADLRDLPAKAAAEKSKRCCGCSACTATVTSRCRPIRKACGKRCCFPLRCCTIPTCCCSTEPFSGDPAAVLELGLHRDGVVP